MTPLSLTQQQHGRMESPPPSSYRSGHPETPDLHSPPPALSLPCCNLISCIFKQNTAILALHSHRSFGLTYTFTVLSSEQTFPGRPPRAPVSTALCLPLPADPTHDTGVQGPGKWTWTWPCAEEPDGGSRQRPWWGF